MIKDNYEDFILDIQTFNDMYLYKKSTQFYDKLGRLTRYGVLRDTLGRYILCVRKHEHPLAIDNTIKKNGTSCCNVAWYYYISYDEYDTLSYFCEHGCNDVSELVSVIQARASSYYSYMKNGGQIYAVAIYEIDGKDANKLSSFFKPYDNSPKGSKEFIKDNFFRLVGA